MGVPGTVPCLQLRKEVKSLARSLSWDVVEARREPGTLVPENMPQSPLTIVIIKANADCRFAPRGALR